jgi:hypothetical protein
MGLECRSIGEPNMWDHGYNPLPSKPKW